MGVVGHAIYCSIFEKKLGHALWYMDTCGFHCKRLVEKKIVTFGEMVIFASPILLPSMWLTFPTMPKLIDLIITTSSINKFAFHAS
jgi:hypothetical protein